MKLDEKSVRYVSQRDVAEVFCDSLKGSSFADDVLRIELCVTRFDELKPPATPTAERTTACRLVLTAACTADLYNHLRGIVALMEQQGKIARVPTAPPTKGSH